MATCNATSSMVASSDEGFETLKDGSAGDSVTSLSPVPSWGVFEQTYTG